MKANINQPKNIDTSKHTGKKEFNMSQSNNKLVLAHKQALSNPKVLQALNETIPQTIKKYLTPERLTRVMLSAISRSPTLAQCTPMSVLKSVMESASLGLEPVGGTLGRAYLVPYRNNKNGGQHEAQLIIGYRGLIELARRSGQILSIEAHIIHSNDDYQIEYGLESKLKHKPTLSKDPGDMVAVYAVATLSDGSKQFEIMTKTQVDAIKDRSRAGRSGPWVSDYNEMARKTVVRRLCKYLPMTIDMAKALDIENRAETGESTGIIDIDIQDLDLDTPAPADHKKEVNNGKTSALADMLESQQTEKPAKQTIDMPPPKEDAPKKEEPQTLHQEWKTAVNQAIEKFGRDAVDAIHDKFSLPQNLGGKWEEKQKELSITIFKLTGDKLPIEEDIQQFIDFVHLTLEDKQLNAA
jgi:recombination protein RecT